RPRKRDPPGTTAPEGRHLHRHGGRGLRGSGAERGARTILDCLRARGPARDAAKAKAYIDGPLRHGLKILPDNSDVWRGVGSGEFALGLTNSPNYHLALKAGLPVGGVYPDQGPSGMGSLVNPNAVAIVKGARHLVLAKRFVDFILSQEEQAILVAHAFVFPLVLGMVSGWSRPLL